MDQLQEQQTVQSFTRGLGVIRSFGRNAQQQSLSQVAEKTGLARATARRFLHTLVVEGYAGTDGTNFWLTPKVLELGFSYLAGLGLPAIAEPHLQSLSRTLGESSSMSVLEGSDIVYVSRIPANQIMTVSISIGTRFPAHLTSMGRVMLCELDPAALKLFVAATSFEARTAETITDAQTLTRTLETVKRQGWCVVDQELEIGLRSLAAPIRDSEGKIVAAINISTHVAKHSLRELKTKFIPEILKTAAAITQDFILSTKV